MVDYSYASSVSRCRFHRHDHACGDDGCCCCCCHRLHRCHLAVIPSCSAASGCESRTSCGAESDCESVTVTLTTCGGGGHRDFCCAYRHCGSHHRHHLRRVHHGPMTTAHRLQEQDKVCVNACTRQSTPQTARGKSHATLFGGPCTASTVDTLPAGGGPTRRCEQGLRRHSRVS